MFEKFIVGKSQEGKEVTRIIRVNSMIVITGRPRSGKTLLAKSLVGQLKHRKILQFDYSGEWGLSKYPNVFSKDSNYGDFLHSLINLEDVGFDISDYDKPSDWMSLGISRGGAVLVSQIAKKKDIHGNDWSTFKKMIKDLPFSQTWVKVYNEKWNMNLKTPMHSESYKNVQKTIDYLDPIFTQPYTKYNFDYLFDKYKYINVNLGLESGDSETQEAKARLIVGKVLEKIKPILYKHRPVIVFEEADILAPKLPESKDVFYSSLNWIKKYVLKLGRRAGCMLFFIVQDDKRCDDVIRFEKDWHIKQMWTPPFSDRAFFGFFSGDEAEKEGSRTVIFKALDSSSQFENYPAVV